MPTEFHEIRVSGKTFWIDGFVKGFLAARNAAGELIDAEQEEIACQTHTEKLREKLGFSQETRHYLCPPGLLTLFEEMESASEAAGKPIKVNKGPLYSSLSFRLHFSVFSREEGRRFRERFDDLPQDVAIRWARPILEIIDPTARGAELYTPVHEYELSGDGLVEGGIPGVLELYRWCRNEDLVSLEAAVLKEAPPSP
ncbi:MAG: hypothetical protein KA419_18065 [Acidobacteria bacterium]|nr:hypothetical protein [Acidobacteriota bacterium]